MLIPQELQLSPSNPCHSTGDVELVAQRKFVVGKF